MGRILVGVIVGALVAGGAGFLWMRSDACLGRCGDGTSCRQERCVAVAAAPVAPATRPKRRRARRGISGGDSPAAPEIQLKPGDEKMIAEGDALGRPERIDLTQPDGRELSQEDFDAVFHQASPGIEKCITDSVGDAPLDSGHVEVGIRVEKSGEVSRVRVEAPALMQHQGLARCVRSAVTSLRFPSSGAANVVTYPFELK